MKKTSPNPPPYETITRTHGAIHVRGPLGRSMYLPVLYATAAQYFRIGGKFFHARHNQRVTHGYVVPEDGSKLIGDHVKYYLDECTDPTHSTVAAEEAARPAH